MPKAHWPPLPQSATISIMHCSLSEFLLIFYKVQDRQYEIEHTVKTKLVFFSPAGKEN